MENNISQGEVSQECRPPLGRYRHYKGGEYELLHLGYHSETRERMAVYRSLYDTPRFPTGIWVRPLTMFLESVQIDGRSVPRFQLIEPAQ